MTEKQCYEVRENVSVKLPYECCGEFFVEDLGEIEDKRIYSFFKRVIDIVFSVLALVICALPIAIIAIMVRLESKGDVFYRQERLGLNGIRFSVIKFRTMYEDAEKDGPQWSEGEDDPRITALGRILRKTRMDELPQFWCILKGDMSIVGPRPEREVFYEEFEKYIHGFRERLKVKPGLTGWAQVRGGYYLKPEEKILYDVEYIKARSFLKDLKIMFITIKVVFKREGAK